MRVCAAGESRLTELDVSVKSKLPDVQTTIFTVMSALAQEHDAINLSQGFPDFDGPRWFEGNTGGFHGFGAS